MVRLPWLVLVASLIAACGGAASPRETRAPPPLEPRFPTANERDSACLLLRDHIVILYADEAARRDRMELSPDERAKFREGWAEELAQRGALQRFAATCVSGLTPRKFTCGMASKTTDGLVACMRLTQADPPTRAPEP